MDETPAGGGAQRRRRGADRGPEVRITGRDRILLAFAAQHRLVLAAHVGQLLGISARAAGRRMHALRSAGLLESERRIHGEPNSWRIRPAGLRAIDSSLPAPHRMDLATYQHDVGLAWLYLAARGGAFGPMRDIIGERRMRSHDGSADGRASRFGVRLGGVGPGGRERLHYPDVVLATESGHRVALELELSTKTTARREGILAGYAADPRIDAVVYLVDKPSVGRAISRSARRLGISNLVHVQRVAFAQADPASGMAPAAERVRRAELDPARSRTGSER